MLKRRKFSIIELECSIAARSASFNIAATISAPELYLVHFPPTHEVRKMS